MKRLIKWLVLALVLLVVIIAAPILYVETSCRGEGIDQAEAQYITDPDWQRPEARTYMVYPEWHIVYAYEGYAAAVADGAPHRFPYISAVKGFWTSLCGLTEKADELGEAGFNSKATIYTIGASFTLEMAFKAAYEETIGRVASWFGPSPQDVVEAEMAADYATFLQQVPWYKYDFPAWSEKLKTAPTEGLRAWERRIALGLEWGAKTQYAKLIAGAAAGLGADELEMQVILKDATTTQVAGTNDAIKDVNPRDGIITATMPRYRVFTQIAKDLAAEGANFLEIAGNDDILVSYLGDAAPTGPGTVISETSRVGFSRPNAQRFLIATKVTDLAELIRALDGQPGALEHIYDY